MGRLNRLYPVLIVALLALYAAVGFYVLHPTANLAYVEYYLSDQPVSRLH